VTDCVRENSAACGACGFSRKHTVDDGYNFCTGDVVVGLECAVFITADDAEITDLANRFCIRMRGRNVRELFLSEILGVHESDDVSCNLNKFRTGDEIEIMKPDGRNIPVRVMSIRNAAGEEVPDAPHPKEELWLTLSEMPDQGDILRTGKE
jgi:hypothetical protein